MSAKFDGRKYGRWEVRMRTSHRDPEYHPVVLLWPDSGNWPCGGEIDFAEGTRDPAKMNFFYHYSCSNKQTYATKARRHAPSGTPTRWSGPRPASSATSTARSGSVTWPRATSRRAPMHLTAQLDWFPDGTTLKPSWMELDWVRVYNLG